MAEIEIHHEHGHEADPLAKKVGMMVGLIGVALAVVTILAHRAHTAAVLERTEANDQWAYYQAKKNREYSSGVGATLAKALGTDPVRTEAAVAKLEAARAKYVADAEKIQEEANASMRKTERAEGLALRYDIGEGFIELGLVLTSLYFLGKQKFFPVGGVSAALLGIAIALSTLLPASVQAMLLP